MRQVSVDDCRGRHQPDLPSIVCSRCADRRHASVRDRKVWRHAFARMESNAIPGMPLTRSTSRSALMVIPTSFHVCSRFEDRVGVRGRALTLLKAYFKQVDRTEVSDDLRTVCLDQRAHTFGKATYQIASFACMLCLQSSTTGFAPVRQSRRCDGRPSAGHQGTYVNPHQLTRSMCGCTNTAHA